jgi:hypothetical protein
LCRANSWSGCSQTDGLCAERDRQLRELKLTYAGTDKVIKGPIERFR